MAPATAQLVSNDIKERVNAFLNECGTRVLRRLSNPKGKKETTTEKLLSIRYPKTLTDARYIGHMVKDFSDNNTTLLILHSLGYLSQKVLEKKLKVPLSILLEMGICKEGDATDWESNPDRSIVEMKEPDTPVFIYSQETGQVLFLITTIGREGEESCEVMREILELQNAIPKEQTAEPEKMS